MFKTRFSIVSSEVYVTHMALNNLYFPSDNIALGIADIPLDFQEC